MMPVPSMSSSSSTTTSPTKTTTPTIDVTTIQDKQHKLVIPVIRPITYTKWATFPSVVIVTEKTLIETGRFIEGTNLKVNENNLRNSYSELKRRTQFVETEELLPIL